MQMFCLLFSKKVEVLNKGGLESKKGGPMGELRGTIFGNFSSV